MNKPAHPGATEPESSDLLERGGAGRTPWVSKQQHASLLGRRGSKCPRRGAAYVTSAPLMEWPLAPGRSRVRTCCRAAARQSEKRALRGGATATSAQQRGAAEPRPQPLVVAVHLKKRQSEKIRQAFWREMGCWRREGAKVCTRWFAALVAVIEGIFCMKA